MQKRFVVKLPNGMSLRKYHLKAKAPQELQETQKQARSELRARATRKAVMLVITIGILASVLIARFLKELV